VRGRSAELESSLGARRKAKKKSHAKPQRRKGNREWTRIDAKQRPTADGCRFTQIRSGWYWMETFVTFVLQREVFKHFDEDLCRREDKIIHNKLTSHEEKIFHNNATKVAKMDPLNF
jgi:hypothetical protein